jgi:hypothetical protein
MDHLEAMLEADETMALLNNPACIEQLKTVG